MSFQRYPGYRPSGIDILGDLPAHWEVRELRQLGRLMKGSGGSKEDVVESGVPCVRYGDLYTTHSFFIEAARTRLTPERAAAYTPIHYGDILFAASGEKLEEIGKAAANMIHGEAVCGGDLILLRPTASVWPRFMGYAADSAPAALQKASMGRGTTVKHIYPDELRHLALALPPLAEQKAIAAFLDRETAKIDALVAEQERLIELLKEKRRAVISHAVTRGLNPDVPMKDSGVEWLGPVPAHWAVKSLRRCAVAVQTGGTPSSEQPSPDVVDGFTWYTPGDFDELLRLGSSVRSVSRSAAKSGEVRVFPARSVLVVSIGATLGKVAFAEAPCSANQQINAVVPGPDVDGWFLTYSLSAKAEVMRFLSNASTIGIMNQEKTKEIVVAVPPLAEQTQIAAYLDAEIGNIECLVDEARRATGLLQERRSALISAAVTGQIDVRPESMRTAA